MLILLILGLFLFLSGIFALYSGYSVKHNCTAEVEGIITGCEVKKAERNDNDDTYYPDVPRRKHHSYRRDYDIYYALITYIIDGAEYKYTRRNSSKMPPEVGGKVMLIYNPRKPKQCNEPKGYVSYITNGWGLITAAVIFILLSLWVVW